MTHGIDNLINAKFNILGAGKLNVHTLIFVVIVLFILSLTGICIFEDVFQNIFKFMYYHSTNVPGLGSTNFLEGFSAITSDVAMASSDITSNTIKGIQVPSYLSMSSLSLVPELGRLNKPAAPNPLKGIKFSYDCCPNTYSNSMGCACVNDAKFS